jgi:hypothetical protein
MAHLPGGIDFANFRAKTLGLLFAITALREIRPLLDGESNLDVLPRFPENSLAAIGIGMKIASS